MVFQTINKLQLIFTYIRRGEATLKDREKLLAEIHRFVSDEKLFKGCKFVIDGQDMEEKVQKDMDLLIEEAEQGEGAGQDAGT